MATATMPELLTSADLAKLFKVDVGTIRIWARAGKIPPALKMSQRHQVWEADAIRGFLTARLAEGRGGAA